MSRASKRWMFAAIAVGFGVVVACSEDESTLRPAGSAAAHGSLIASAARATGTGGVAVTGGTQSAGSTGGASNPGGSQGISGVDQAASRGNARVAGAASSGGINSVVDAGGPLVILKPGTKNWVFLMLGQSNMEGAAPLDPIDQVNPTRVFKITHEKQWVPAAEPGAFWGYNTLSPSRSFGMKILEKVTNPEVNILLINAAVGGTAIAHWNPQNGEHYLGMLPYLEAGMQIGTVRGFIWHQGESDSDITTTEYATRFRALVKAIRNKVGDPMLPVVAGQVGTDGDNGAVNDALALVAMTDPLMHVSSSEGLSLIPEDVHYDKRSVRLMGEKFATEWWSILGK